MDNSVQRPVLENLGIRPDVPEHEVCRSQLPWVEVGPTNITIATMQAALEFTNSLLQSHGHHYFCFCEASLLSSLIRDAELARELRTADAVFPDGIALVALARLRAHVLPERITGPGFLLAACAYGVARGWRHFFYGGEPGVADVLAERLRRKFPGIIIAGTHSPPFRALSAEEELETKQMDEHQFRAQAGRDTAWQQGVFQLELPTPDLANLENHQTTGSQNPMQLPERGDHHLLPILQLF